MAMVFCRGCAKELHESALTCTQCGAPQALSRQFASERADAVPAGVRGWCWGGFLLSWIWAIGNKTWWGLLALIPYVNFGVIIWLGLHGREMAWKNRQWDSVEHFNRVQRAWTQWALGLMAASVAVVVAIVVAAAMAQGGKPAAAVSMAAPAADMAIQDDKPAAAADTL